MKSPTLGEIDGERVPDDGESNSECSGREEECEYIFDAVMNKTYLRGRFLGKGAHATVYLATDISEDIQKDYAIKVMNLENLDEENDVANIWKGRSREMRLSQVLREVDIHGLMSHSNVVQMESYFQDRTKFYIVLEHCEMKSLAQLLRSRGRLEEEETRRYLKQLLDGLQHIHDRGIIHRDLKPANIYFTGEMVLKIGDFGLADRISTKSRGICGTPNYISPEVLMEQGYTTAVDVWAVGCITYYMICGKPPFEAATPSATYDLIRAHKYSAVPSSQAGAALRHLIGWMLAFRPEDRPSISFIKNHVWMRKTRETKQLTWMKSHKKRKESTKMAPMAEITTELAGECSRSGEAQAFTDKNGRTRTSRKSFLFWRNFFDKARFYSKVLSCEDVNNKPIFHQWRSKIYFALSSKKREFVRKMIADVVNGRSREADDCGQFEEDPRQFPAFVCKWIDYSNKYGFGYEMADGTTGVFFNDSSQISLNGSKTKVTWFAKSKKVSHHIQSLPQKLQPKLLLLNYFLDYMEGHLSSGVTDNQKQSLRLEPGSLLKQWMRNEKVILFETTTGLLQINFFADHYKLIFYRQDRQEKSHVTLLVIDGDNNVRKYNLSKMKTYGCPYDVLPHLKYIYRLI